MGFSLGNLLHEAVAQINPFDHGATAATVARNAQRPAPAQLPSQNRSAPTGGGWSFSRAANDLVHNPITNYVANDIVKPADYAVHAATNLPQTVNNDIVKPIQRDVLKPAGRIAAATPAYVGHTFVQPLVQFPIDAATQIYNNGIAPTFQLPHLSPNETPLRGINKKIQATGSLHQTVSSGAQTALTLASGGLTNLAEKGATAATGFLAPGAADAAVTAARLGLNQAKTPLVDAAIKYGTGALAGGAINSGVGAATAAGAGASPKQILKSAGQNAAIGAGLGVGTPLLADALKLAKTSIPEQVHTHTPAVIAGAKSVLADQSGFLSLGSGATRNPAVRALDAHMKQLNNARAQMVANGLSETSSAVKANARAYKSTLLEKQRTINSIKQGGFAKIPGSSNPESVGSILNNSQPTMNKAELKSLAATPEGKANVNLNEGAFSAADRANLDKQNAIEDAQHQVKPIPKQPTPKAPAIENTAKNPIKVNIPEVAQGDYAKARSNTQLAATPILSATDVAARAVKKLGLDSSTFGKMVENPKLAKTAAEKHAVALYNQLTNTVHATSQALGGNTNYVKNYFRHQWDLSNPADAARFEELAKKNGVQADPFNFGGVNSQPRVFKSIAEGEGAGFHLADNNPLSEVQNYGKASAGVLRKQALSKGFTEADMGEAVKNRSFDLRNGTTLPLSERGLQEIKSFESTNKPGKILGGERKLNRGLKQTLLSASEFHPINIAALKDAPALALSGHPVKAAEGLYNTFRAQVGNKYADKLAQNRIANGNVENAARIGMPYGSSDYAASGKIVGSGGVGEHTIFNKAMPAMQDKVVESIVADLKKKGISLDSPEARRAGLVGNKLLGYVNREVQNLDPHVQKALSDFMLSPQFTRSKWELIKDALSPKSYGKGGVAGKYAATAILGNTAAVGGLAVGAGALLGQKSDSVKDTLIRNIIHPSIPTPFKDKKGNTVELGLPSTYLSEALGLGLNLKRNNDGHLGIGVNPHDIPGNLTNYGRARLAALPGTGLKIATNTDFANKPLSDPNAPLGTRFEQGATTLGSGMLPIGLQGAVQTNAIKKHLPGPVQDVLDAASPGSNPLLKSIGSSFGATPRTDKTVGKGLQTDQYFNALDDAKRGLNRQEKDAIDLYTGGKKNPVTEQYQITPSAYDSSAKAKVLLQNPKVIDNLIAMNKGLQSKGQTTDPLWNLSKDQIIKAFQYQAMPPGGADRTHWMNENKKWYSPLADQRSKFFDSLPAGDPNKPKAPIEYPSPSSTITAKQNAYFKIDDAAKAAKYIADNPDLQQQLDKETEYNNNMRVAQGYGALDTFQKATPQVQKIIDLYNNLPKNDGPKGGNKTRSLWIQAHPDEYGAMTKYFTQSSIYSLEKDAGQAQFKNTGFSQKGLKDIYSLGQYDVKKSTDANGNTIYSLGGGSSSGGYSGKSTYGAKGSKGKRVSFNQSAITSSNASLDNSLQSMLNKARISSPGKLTARKVASMNRPKTQPTFKVRKGKVLA